MIKCIIVKKKYLYLGKKKMNFFLENLVYVLH